MKEGSQGKRALNDGTQTDCTTPLTTTPAAVSVSLCGQCVTFALSLLAQCSLDSEEK